MTYHRIHLGQPQLEWIHIVNTVNVGRRGRRNDKYKRGWGGWLSWWWNDEMMCDEIHLKKKKLFTKLSIHKDFLSFFFIFSLSKNKEKQRKRNLIIKINHVWFIHQNVSGDGLRIMWKDVLLIILMRNKAILLHIISKHNWRRYYGVCKTIMDFSSSPARKALQSFGKDFRLLALSQALIKPRSLVESFEPLGGHLLNWA